MDAVPLMFFSLIFTAFLLTASSFDAVRFRIPNLIPLAIVILFALKVASSSEPVPWLAHLASLGFLLALGFLGFAGGVMGGGDAKLLASVGCWFGPALLPSLILITGISGGILAMTLLVLRRLRRRVPAAVMAADGPTVAEDPLAPAPHLLDQGAPIPYALAIGAAGLWLEWL